MQCCSSCYEGRPSVNRMIRASSAGFTALFLLGLFVLLVPRADAQARRQPAAPPTLGLQDGTMDFDTPDFNLKLVKDSQTIAALQPKGANGFDFTPADRLDSRSSDGYFHLGDLTFRARQGTTGDWTDYSSAAARHPVTALPVSGDALAAADLSATLPVDCPLQITRTWALENGKLVLRFAIKNNTTGPVQLGALGIAMVFNNIMTGRNQEQEYETCSFSDPYIGLDAGYIQVTRLNGKGPTLVVVPDGETPFEAYRPLGGPERPAQTAEGMFAWTVYSQAYAENEWKNATPWNAPTMATLAPGETRTYGVKFLVSDEIPNIDKTLMANGRPVAIGIPGYILPQDIDGKLFLNYGHKISRIAIEPKGAISVQQGKPTSTGWQQLTLHGKGWGRARVTLTYGDGLKQSIHYYVIKPETKAVNDLGHFLLTKQWFVDPNDPFHRSPSVISYDRQANKQVQQDSRVWIAGLSDEAGAGSWLAAGMKQFGLPDKAELDQYEQFVDNVLWGGIQYSSGPRMYGVRKSMFYYDPKALPTFPYDPSFNWTSWTSWNIPGAEDTGRGYNYPHVVAVYWSMYRLARNHPGLVTNHPWEWYLDHAYQTVKFLTSINEQTGDYNVGYVDTGLMEGNVFLALLNDLKREGWTDQAAQMEKAMKRRADLWGHEAYPFGSEMAWDSTGQSEIYEWCKYFGFDDKAQVCLDSILGYMPTLPHWGYNGNARRYWDFLYGGKLTRIERQIHHYGSGINAIPVLDSYREHPDDFYLLQVGYGGTMGGLSNIDQDGFASAAFHTYPQTLQWDAYSGDYGPNFFGHAWNTGTYIIDHPDFGWQSYGGNVKVDGDWVKVTPKDDFRMRVYVAPRGLYLTLDAGTFQEVDVNTKTHEVRVGLSPEDQYTPSALLMVSQSAKVAGVGTYQTKQHFDMTRGGYSIPLGSGVTWVDLSDGS